MKVALSLNTEQKEMLKPIAKDLTMDFNKCSAFCQYYSLFNNKKIKIVKDVDNILHAHEYDKNDSNTFWLVLTKELVMLDLCIPDNLDMTSQTMLLNLSSDEVKLIKLLKFN
jgi:hypothetical protein